MLLINQDLNLEIGMTEEDINIPLCVNENEEDNFEKQSKTIEGDKKKRDKTTTSGCWKYFTKIEVDKDGKYRARCNSCNRIYLIGGRKYGTSHLNLHVMKCDKRKTKDVGEMILDMLGKLKGKKINQVVHRE